MDGTTDCNTGSDIEPCSDGHGESKLSGMCLAVPYIPAAGDGTTIPGGAGGAVLIQEDHLWDNGAVITYTFMPPYIGHPKTDQAKVHEVVKEWSRYANITFEYVPKPEDALVRIMFHRGRGSWSLVGKRRIEDSPKDQPTMNLGDLERIKFITDVDKGVILHEFGHVLGLKHEHQSPARDEIYTLNEAYTIQAFGEAPNYWTPIQVKEQILDPILIEKLCNYTDLDMKSIMMYFMPAEQNDKGIEIKPNNELSDYDKAFMLVHYPSFGFEPEVEGWDFDKALDILGIQGEACHKMLELYGQGNVREVRRYFATVYESVRASRNASLAKVVSSKGL